MAVRIAGIVIPQNKRIVIALTYVYGIGLTRSQQILKEAKVDESIRAKDLTEEQANEIREIVRKKFKVEGDLRRDVMGNIKRLKDVKAYRGVRHEKKLPVRGQRTKTNQRTAKGNKRISMGSGRVAVAKK